MKNEVDVNDGVVNMEEENAEFTEGPRILGLTVLQVTTKGIMIPTRTRPIITDLMITFDNPQ